LLDTGIRAAELSEMQIQQVDIKNKRIRVMGKGNAQRVTQRRSRRQRCWFTAAYATTGIHEGLA